ncbi:MAG: hypothetical protein CM1200mP29_00010 [Verrucomicrobiota bacterium]|nr:MAG: hypothetical protein CM1200mP29_00010 [Verrucomicrobiota bacterium]
MIPPFRRSPHTRADAEVLSGGKVGFIVKAVGEPLAYQWLFDGRPIVGQASPNPASGGDPRQRRPLLCVGE